MAENSLHKVNLTTIKRKQDARTPPVSELQSKALQLEDEFQFLYYQGEGSEGNIIAPPHDPRRLRRMVTQNNTLKQAVSVMEVNVASTGWEVERKDGEKVEEENPEVQKIESFLGEVFPGVSWITVNRRLRVDLEETGNAYLEVLRNPRDEIIFINRVDPVTMRLIRLDDAIQETKEVMRNGVSVSTKVGIRERRFVQKVGTNLVYFKEFGATRDVDRITGEWSEQGQRFSADKRATEILHFIVDEDSDTPYGLPRWINQMPSVLGSRMAEELNLDYFASGGIPPVLVTVSGGALVGEAKAHLEELLGGAPKDKLRAAIIEVEPTGGAIDSSGSVKVEVERFGSEQQTDSLFEGYNEKCGVRVRGSFRLPPLFFGLAESYNFATAFASYLVAEAQVFKPERDEDDEILNTKILQAMGIKDHVIRSLGLAVTDVVDKLKGLEIAATNGWIAGEDGIDVLNEISGLNMTFTEMEVEAEEEFEGEGLVIEGEAGRTPEEDFDTDRAPKSPRSKGVIKRKRRIWKKVADPFASLTVAKSIVEILGTPSEGVEGVEELKHSVKAAYQSLPWEQREVCMALVQAHLTPEAHMDNPEFSELCKHAQESMIE